MYTPLSFYKLVNQQDRSGLLDNVKDKADFIAIYDETKYYLFEGYLDKGKKFSSYTSFYNWYNTLSESKKHCHEVIFGSNTQRIKFDIDAKPQEFGEINSNKNIDTLNSIMIAIKEELKNYIGIDEFIEQNITNADFNIADSSDNNKISYHITSLFYTVANNKEAKLFSDNVINRLPECYKKFIDSSINTSIKNLRILGSHKVDSNRVKKINKELNKKLGFNNIGDYQGLEYYLIQPPKIRCRTIALPNKIIVSNDTFSSKSLESSLCSTEIPNYIKAYIYDNGSSIREVKNTVIYTDRIKPSYCEICDRTHQNDNTLIISILICEQNKTYLAKCRHSDSKRFIKIIDTQNVSNVIDTVRFEDKYYESDGDIIDDDAIDNAINNEIDDDTIDDSEIICNQNKEPIEQLKKPKENYIQLEIDRLNKDKSKAKTITKFDLLPNKLIYNEPIMRPYTEDYPTVIYQAQMGVGKTEELRKLYKRDYCNSNKSNISVILTARSVNIIKAIADFPDFKSYDEIKGFINLKDNNKIACQVESIYRITTDFETIPELLILDELESILNQFKSGLHKKLNSSFAKFVWLLRHSKKVIILDANLTNRTYNIIINSRNSDLNTIFLHKNEYKRASGDNYRLALDYASYISELYKHLDNDKKIDIPTTSKTEADALYRQLIEKYPNKNIGLLTADTSESIKKEQFKDVNNHWNKYDVLIRTPTITAGISFTATHFNYSMPYLTDTSCDTDTVRQMIARSRCITEKEYCYYIKSSGFKQLADTPDKLRQYMKHSNNIFLQDTNDLPHYVIDESGELIYSKSAYYEYWIDTVALLNESKNNFTNRLNKQLIDSGANVSTFTLFSDNTKPKENYRKIINNKKKEIKTEKIENIAIAENIDYSWYKKLKNDKDNFIDLTDAEKFQLEKWELADKFKIDQSLIDLEFVKTYTNKEYINRVNLKYILELETLDASLLKIKQNKTDKIDYISQIKECMPKGISEDKNNYTKHYKAIELIKLFGFNDVFDDKKITCERMENNVNKLYDYLLTKDTLSNYDNTFELRKFNTKKINELKKSDPDDFTKEIIKWGNVILNTTYGIKVHLKRQEYILQSFDINKLFYIDTEYNKEEQNGRPFILSKRIANKAKG